MTGYRQHKPKNGLTKCPDLVDHYILHTILAEMDSAENASKQVMQLLNRMVEEQNQL